jgi:hypothetical protein
LNERATIGRRAVWKGKNEPKWKRALTPKIESAIDSSSRRDLPEADRFAMSAAMAVGALYDVGRIGKVYNFMVCQRSMEALQSDYVKTFLKDLHMEVKFEGCGSFCLAWLERVANER